MIQKLFILCVCTAFLISCDDSTGPDDNMPTNGKHIEIVSPNTGDVFRVGDSVEVSFKIDGSVIDLVSQDISITGGATWKSILDSSVTITEPKGVLGTFIWVIGQETNTVGYADTNANCVLKVYKYNSNDTLEIDKTGKFTVIK